MISRAWVCCGALAGAAACGPPTCKSVPVQLPASEAVVPWLDGGYATVQASLGGGQAPLVLDTGFDQTSLGTAAAAAAPSPVTVGLGPVNAGPLSYGLLLSGAGSGGVLGNDVLFQLPLVFDARARVTRVGPSFSPADPGAVPLTFQPTRRCRDDAQPSAGPLGPYPFLVPVTLDGQSLRMVLDTGAAATFARGSVAAGLSPRPAISGVLVSTPFAGVISASATRAKALSVGSATSADSLLVSAPEVDRELDRISASLAGAPAVDGFLGWTFWREFSVSLAGAASAATDRTVALTRFSTQTHWTRDLVGVGAVTQASSSPAGLEILAFLSASPARDAGLQVGDVIVTVGGAPALDAPSPFAPAGTSVTLGVQRGTQPFSVSVVVADLLPDPP